MSKSKNDIPVAGGRLRQTAHPVRGQYDAIYTIIDPQTNRPSPLWPPGRGSCSAQTYSLRIYSGRENKPSNDAPSGGRSFALIVHLFQEKRQQKKNRQSYD